MKSSHQSNFCYLPAEPTTFYRFISFFKTSTVLISCVYLLNKNKWEINSALPKNEKEKKNVKHNKTRRHEAWKMKRSSYLTEFEFESVMIFEWKTGSKFMCQTIHIEQKEAIDATSDYLWLIQMPRKFDTVGDHQIYRVKADSLFSATAREKIFRENNLCSIIHTKNSLDIKYYFCTYLKSHNIAQSFHSFITLK